MGLVFLGLFLKITNAGKHKNKNKKFGKTLSDQTNGAEK